MVSEFDHRRKIQAELIGLKSEYARDIIDVVIAWTYQARVS